MRSNRLVGRASGLKEEEEDNEESESDAAANIISTQFLNSLNARSTSISDRGVVDSIKITFESKFTQ
jgi:hypothetical protein